MVHVGLEDIWIDAVIPARSPLHEIDVGQAFLWLGRVWRDALAEVLSSSDDRLRLAQPASARLAADRRFFCFAEVGHGEVLLDDRKVVGISQRRTRTWTRLQSLFVPRWDPEAINEAVSTAIGGLPSQPSSLGAAPFNAREVKAGLPSTVVANGDVVTAFLGRLPTVWPEST